MAEQPVGERRREARQAGAVPVLVGGKLGTGTRFDEKTTTVDVSARGARVQLRLQIKLEPGTEVTVENLASGEQQVFRVARVGERVPGGYEIGLEAADAKPGFWGAAAY
ncbi:MAG: hypothetical protein A2620_03870 [Acidobacteria bacterium RIFCSPHIGHO2_01_FULL_67_28]|nr:MAG: hypothetical protein A2620_03870 [Acidobacteria bacterium RIFCSPHIGHO2_01_FULL_67_28]